MADPATIAHIRAMVLDQQIVKRAELPPDVAGTLVFLVSDESAFITGHRASRIKSGFISPAG